MRPWACELPPQTLKTKRWLSRHVNKCHKPQGAQEGESGFDCSLCLHRSTTAKDLVEHWATTCTPPATAKTCQHGKSTGSTPASFTSPTLTSEEDDGEFEVNKVTEDPEERLRYEFVLWAQRVGQKRFHHLHKSYQTEEGGLEYGVDEDLLNLLDVVHFSVTYNLSSAGTQEVIKVWKRLSGNKSETIRDLPVDWRTTESRIVKHVDTTSLVVRHYPVPDNLGFDFDSVPCVLKSFKAGVVELLTNVELLAHGSFWFGLPPDAGGKTNGRDVPTSTVYTASTLR